MGSFMQTLTRIANGLRAGDGTGDDLRSGASLISANFDAVTAAINAIASSQNSGLIAYATKAAMDADLTKPDGTLAQVTNDATPANNQAYRKNGAAGSGSWAAAFDRLANALGNGAGFQAPGTGGLTRAIQVALWEQPISVRGYGVVSDGITDDSIAFQKAIDACAASSLGSNGRDLYVPGGVTLLKGIQLKPGVRLIFSRSAIVRPAASGSSATAMQDVFYTADDINLATLIVVRGGRFENPGGKSYVRFFNLPQFRHGSTLEDIKIDGGGKALGCVGVNLSKLNWNTKIDKVDVANLGTGIVFRNAAAVLLMRECMATGCAVGFDALYDPVNDVDRVTRLRFIGAVCQFNDVGFKLRKTLSTLIDGVHLENNTLDVDSDGCENLTVLYPEMSGNNTGLTSIGIKLRNTLGARIQWPTMAGIRQAGFFDVDTTNVGAVLRLSFSGVAPLINTAFASYPGTLSGLALVPDTGSGPRTLGSTNIDLNQPYDIYTKTVSNGGVALTTTNAVEGRKVRLILRTSTSYVSGAITFNGTDITGSAPGGAGTAHNKYVEFVYFSSVGGWVCTYEGSWR